MSGPSAPSVGRWVAWPPTRMNPPNRPAHVPNRTARLAGPVCAVAGLAGLVWMIGRRGNRGNGNGWYARQPVDDDGPRSPTIEREDDDIMSSQGVI